jgi:hypothetical protein
MQVIIYNLLSNGNQDFKHISEYSPFFEIQNTWKLQDGCAEQSPSGSETFLKDQYEEKHLQLKWRVFNTHLRWDMMPKCENMRYIYVVRNGKDVALSFFQHLSNQDDSDCFNGTLLDFVTNWCDGEIPFGNWVHHLQSWMSAYENCKASAGGTPSTVVEGSSGPILLVRYEDMIVQPFQVIMRIIAFLELDISAERAQELLQFVSFEYMKQHQEQYMPISVPWKEGFSFIRNGKIGDSDKYFSQEHNAVYMKMLEKIFASGEPKANCIPSWLSELNVV